MRKQYLSRQLQKVKMGLIAPTGLICVSKTYPDSDVALLYELGERNFGENQVSELEKKAQALVQTCPEIKFHMIGHLQTNKVKKLFSVPRLVSIHSVDSLRLIEAMLKEEKHLTHTMNIFLQVKTSDEAEKSGFESEGELQEAIQLLSTSSMLKFYGLMTMGKIRTDDQLADAKVCFQKLLDIRNKLKKSFPELPFKLSMGMSADYPLASQMGADWVRVGSLIFGNRS